MHFHHFALEVNKLDVSLRFYQEVLGFQEEAKLYVLGERIIFLTKGAFRLELLENPKRDNHNGNSHICFQVENIEEEMLRLRNVGLLEIEGPYHLENDWNIVFYEGPDGEIIELLEDINEKSKSPKIHKINWYNKGKEVKGAGPYVGEI